MSKLSATIWLQTIHHLYNYVETYQEAETDYSGYFSCWIASGSRMSAGSRTGVDFKLLDLISTRIWNAGECHVTLRESRLWLEQLTSDL
jgi:hypothetical protein